MFHFLMPSFRSISKHGLHFSVTVPLLLPSQKFKSNHFLHIGQCTQHKISVIVNLVPASFQSSQQRPTTTFSSQSIGPNVIILVNNSQSLCSRCSYLVPTSVYLSQQLLFTASFEAIFYCLSVHICIPNMSEQFFHASLVSWFFRVSHSNGQLRNVIHFCRRPTLYHLQNADITFQASRATAFRSRTRQGDKQFFSLPAVKSTCITSRFALLVGVKTLFTQSVEFRRPNYILWPQHFFGVHLYCMRTSF